MESSSGDRPTGQRPYHVEPSVEDFAWRPSSSTGAGFSGAGSNSSSSQFQGGSGGVRASTSFHRHDPTNYGGYLTNNDYNTSVGKSGRRMFDFAGSSDDAEGTSITNWISGVVSASILGYCGTALVMPFEVGKTLLQVQYIPKETFEEVDVWKGEEGSPYFDYGNDSAGMPETEDDVEMMFTDAMNNQDVSGRAFNNDLNTQLGEMQQDIIQRDADGYLLRRSVYDPATKPVWIIPEPCTSGVWDMVRTIGRFNNEGYTSLWKGQLTTFIINSISTTVQPFIQSILSHLFLAPELLPSLPIVHSPHPLLPLTVAGASHAVTGVLLLPLDLVRTRLIVQSAHPRHRTYLGPLHALKSIIKNETVSGSIIQLYTDPLLLFPALLDSTLGPVLNLATPLLIERYFNISGSEQPVAYGLAEFFLGISSVLVTLPIETVRRRLQVQRRVHRKRLGQNPEQLDESAVEDDRLKTCVETRDRPYFGIVHCIYSMLVEETSRSPIPSRRQRRKFSNNSRDGSESLERMDSRSRQTVTGGLAQLYRGFSMSLGLNVAVFLLQLATGNEEFENGWAEM